VIGFVNGETLVTSGVAGDALLAVAGGGVNVGQYAITVGVGTLAASNYDFPAAELVSGTLEITPAALVIRADDQNMMYGAPLPSFTASYEGLVNGDTPASLSVPPTLATAATSDSPPGSYEITAAGAIAPNYTISYVSGTLDVVAATVAGRQLFYNESIYDGGIAGINSSDDLAIAIDKSAYLPGSGLATFASVSSYMRGINGIMVDLFGSHPNVTAADFVFRLGNDNSPEDWIDAPAPTGVVVRPGAGAGGADRVEITWASAAIRNTWLQVEVLSNPRTGLAASDVFYWGSRVGDSGLRPSDAYFVTSAIDKIHVTYSIDGSVDIRNTLDFNRDGRVTATDGTVVLASIGSTFRLNLGLGALGDNSGDRGLASALAVSYVGAFTSLGERSPAVPGGYGGLVGQSATRAIEAAMLAIAPPRAERPSALTDVDAVVESLDLDEELLAEVSAGWNR